MGGICAIILAAGESRRMGFPKMLLPFGERTMIETVINNVIGSEVNSTMIVVGAGKERIIDILSNMPVSYYINDNYKDGMLSSVICGIKNLPSDCEAFLVFQGDQPLIKKETINIVIESYKISGKGIIIPVFRKRRGHPVMISSKYIDSIEKLDQSKGLQSLASLHPEDVFETDTIDPGILRDFDTYDDYKNEIN